MTARLLLLLAALLLPGALAAQTVPVRSGEHGGFTRLVFDIPPGTGWRLSQEGARLRLDLAGKGLRIDTGQVFQRIDRSRLAAITAEPGGGADLDLACDCIAEAFVLRERMLVLDIRPAATPAEPAAPAPAAASGLAADLARLRWQGGPGIGPAPVAPPLLPLLPSLARPADPGAAMPPAGGDPGAVAEAAALGEALAQDLAAAATAGLLDAAGTAAPRPSALPPAADPAPEAPAAAPDHAARLAADLAAIDPAGGAGSRIAIGAAPCLPEASLAIADWAGPAPDIAQVLAQRRSAVFGEFDRLDAAALLAYARALLHFGFGAEAGAALAGHAGAEAALLRAMARLVDGAGQGSAVLSGQTGCPGAAALWSLLNLPEGARPQTVDSAAVLRSFELLPQHLRAHLGPMLAARLSDSGHGPAARDLLNRLERSAGQETDSIALGRAKLDIKAGDLAAAEAPLKDLASAGSPQTPEAVLAAITVARRTGKPVPAHMVELAEAYAVEFRGDPRAGAFRRAHVSGLLLNGAFESAFAVIETSEETEMPPEARAGLRDEALQRLTEAAGDLAFLKLALAALAQEQHPTRASDALAMATRFLDLGLPDAALRQLAPLSAEAPQAGAASLLRARALLALGRPEEAEILLLSGQGPEVDRLRAEARRRMGDHALAGTLYAELGEAALARRAAWLSGDWPRVASAGEDALARAAALAAAPPEEAPEEPSLAAAEGLSARSEETRAAIRALLAETRMTPD